MALFSSLPKDSSDEASSSSSSSGMGWLKGPVSKQTTVLRDDEWVSEVDDQSQTIWRSRITGEATVPGVPKPQTWHQVVDKKSGLLYYWCPETNETTELGEERPGAYGRRAIYKQKSPKLDSTEGKGKEKDLTFLQLYNNPLGWLLLGMALWGIAVKIFF